MRRRGGGGGKWKDEGRKEGKEGREMWRGLTTKIGRTLKGEDAAILSLSSCGMHARTQYYLVASEHIGRGGEREKSWLNGDSKELVNGAEGRRK